jgi:hypothetical protein
VSSPRGVYLTESGTYLGSFVVGIDASGRQVHYAHVTPGPRQAQCIESEVARAWRRLEGQEPGRLYDGSVATAE